MDENRPAKPTGERGAKGAGMAADFAKALGVEEAKVTAILEANRPAKPTTRPADGTRPAKPDQTKLIAALASGLGIDEAKVKAALTTLQSEHQADHEARHTAMYAALAKSLNLETSAVQAAFEAVRPARPAK